MYWAIITDNAPKTNCNKIFKDCLDLLMVSFIPC